jgi:hypothetical protein
MTGALEEPHYRRLSVDTARERDDPRLVATSRAHEHRAQGHHQERIKEEIDFNLESESDGTLTLTLRSWKDGRIGAYLWLTYRRQHRRPSP